MFNGHRSNAVRSPKTSHSTPGLMSRHPLAGKPAPKDLLIDVGQLEAAFYEAKPDPGDPNQLVSFGTSGHRGTSLNATFTESHILAITQAICDSLGSPVFADGLGDGENVRFGKRRIQAGAAMAARAKANELIWVARIGFCLVEGCFELTHID